jgi:dTDP-4-amino-4,6-dideoxygalactose transaminase
VPTRLSSFKLHWQNDRIHRFKRFIIIYIGRVIVTDSEEYYEKLKRFRLHGIINQNLLRDKGLWYYDMVDLGYNYRMTDLQAALGISQMDKLDHLLKEAYKYPLLL